MKINIFSNEKHIVIVAVFSKLENGVFVRKREILKEQGKVN